MSGQSKSTGANMGAHYSAWSPCACSRMSLSLTSPSPRRPPLRAEELDSKVPSEALSRPACQRVAATQAQSDVQQLPRFWSLPVQSRVVWVHTVLRHAKHLEEQ